MSKISIKYNQKDLFVYFQYLRLQTAKNVSEKNLKNTLVTEGDSFGNKFFKNIKRTIKGFDKKDNNLDIQLNDFKNNNPFPLMNSSDALTCSTWFFKDDEFGLAKLIFATSIILDNEYVYEYEDSGLIEVSKILYSNPLIMSEIKAHLFDNYKAIASKSLSSSERKILVGASIAALIGVATLPVLLSGGLAASASVTTGALAIHGFGDMQLGIAAIATKSLLVSAAMIGAAYGGIKLYNDIKVKKEFKELTPEKNALYLAIQCTCIQRAKNTLSTTKFKEQLDMILKNLSVLKSDLDYYLFVENESVNNNKEKILSFHAFEKRLIKVLGV